MVSARPPSLLARLLRAREGAVAVEFVFTFPILLLMLFSMVEIGNFLLVKRRLNTAGSSVGDVIARMSQIDTPTITDIFNAGGDIMGAATATPPDIRVGQVVVTPKGTFAYEWTDAQGTSMPVYAHCTATTLTQLTALQAQTATQLPTGARVLVAEMQYTWNSPLNYLLRKPIVIKSTSVFSPRQSSITRVGAQTSACNG